MDLSDRNLLVQYLDGREAELIDVFIADGPTEVKLLLAVNEQQWRWIFDYLVFEHNLIYKCVLANVEFFVDTFVENGEKHLRFILDVYDARYDDIWKPVFDLLAVSFDALYLHVLEHREKYSLALKTRGGDFLRVLLGVAESRYDGVWETILNFLHTVICNGIFSEMHLERGIEGFSKLLNQTREHRALIFYR